MTDSSFVFGWVLDGQGGGIPITDPAGPAQPQQWLHFDYSHPSIIKKLDELGLPNRVIESLTRVDTRPRTAILEDGILVLLRGVNMNPGADPEDMVSLRLWITPEFLITVRQRRLFAVQEVGGLIGKGEGPKNIPDLVTLIIEHLADRIARFVDELEDRLERFEDAVETESPQQIRPKVSAVRRQTAAVRRFLSPQRDALDTLYRDSKRFLSEDVAFSVREQADRIARYVEDLDLVRERALVVQEELINRIAQEQNARMYVLSLVAAIFLPITFITGLFGMNVAGLPGLEDSKAFTVVAGAMVLVSIGTIVVFKYRKWL
jgi:zinc transporter